MTFTLLAEDTAPKAAPPEMGLFNPMTVMMVVMVLFVFVVMMPRQRRQQQQMVASIKRGTRVVTQAGIIGTVDTVKDAEDEMTVRSGDARLKVLKSSVVRVLGQDEETK
jgi:preprotein translocase subunit YajC